MRETASVGDEAGGDMMKKLTADDIIKLLATPETDRVEFKESQSTLPQSFWDSYSAFANTDGGIILREKRRKVDAGNLEQRQQPPENQREHPF